MPLLEVPKEEREYVSAYVPERILNQLEVEASLSGRPKSSLVRQAIKEFLSDFQEGKIKELPRRFKRWGVFEGRNYGFFTWRQDMERLRAIKRENPETSINALIVSAMERFLEKRGY